MRLLLTLFTILTLSTSPVYAGHGNGEETDAVHSHAAFESDINVNVNGLVCDFCARALEKVFGKREEVNAIDVDLDNALVAIDIKDGMSIPDEEIKQMITDSGYNVVEIKHVGAE